MAIGLFRPMLENIQEANAVPVLAFSTLIACLSFAMPQTSANQSTVPSLSSRANYVKDLLDMFRLVRGVKGVMSGTWTWVADSPVAALLLSANMEDPDEPLGYDAEVAVRELENHIRTDAETEGQKIDYLDAMQHFRRCFPRGTAGKHCQGLVLAWPFLVSDKFFLAMVEGQHIALVILGFFGALLHMLKSVWWVGDKGRQLVAAVCNILPAERSAWMTWVRMRVNLNYDHHWSTTDSIESG
ncbi:hypothetical protein VE04_02842 [Pseudogymnoascus sp. 24MN13]|nr:hypothetical protein VE04_02842 [Pseudogymnoascus sp. 24MN13]